MRRTILLCLTLLGLVAWSGCARRSAPPSAAPPPTPETGRLWRALDAEILSREQLEELMRLEAEIGDQLGDRLAEVALDSLAPPLARAHSLRLLGERHWTGGLGPFRSALEARDPRLRAAAAVGLAGLIPMDQTAALRLLGRALQDPEPGVQAKAL
ncbi:MAG: hypothetical protein HY703_04840, partial [Gemmatimonadetes bacterium]|nr:hypothetical protein [Gemmatimonadota bacterium]